MTWQQLDVGVLGGGIGGLAVATSLRRAGHKVTVYERADFAGEVGASISCAMNGTQWLHRWGVDVPLGRPVVLEKLIRHNWETGKVEDVYDLSDYKDKWGYVYNMFHRVNMHQMLMESACGEGSGPRAELKVNHKATSIDHESGTVTFSNGVSAQHHMLIGADGIGSSVRRTLGITPQKQQSTSTCLHAVVPTEKVRRLGLTDLSPNNAIEFWGGEGIDKIVFSPCRDGEIHSFYCFFPTAQSDHAEENWNHESTADELLAPYPHLDPALRDLFAVAEDIGPWRLWNHSAYPLWVKGRTAILGDAAHPMMPDQSQGACQAIEDAAALGLVFGSGVPDAEGNPGRDHGYCHNVAQGLRLYEAVRKPRATKVQEASARARENINERIGFSSHTKYAGYKIASEDGKLTVDEMNLYNMWDDVADKAARFPPNAQGTVNGTGA